MKGLTLAERVPTGLVHINDEVSVGAAGAVAASWADGPAAIAAAAPLFRRATVVITTTARVVPAQM
jgi:hypothetical protein